MQTDRLSSNCYIANTLFCSVLASVYSELFPTLEVIVRAIYSSCGMLIFLYVQKNDIVRIDHILANVKSKYILFTLAKMWPIGHILNNASRIHKPVCLPSFKTPPLFAIVLKC